MYNKAWLSHHNFSTVHNYAVHRMIFCQNVDKPKKMTVGGQGICQSIHWLKCNNHVLHSKNYVNIHRSQQLTGGLRFEQGGLSPPSTPSNHCTFDVSSPCIWLRRACRKARLNALDTSNVSRRDEPSGIWACVTDQCVATTLNGLLVGQSHFNTKS